MSKSDWELLDVPPGATQEQMGFDRWGEPAEPVRLALAMGTPRRLLYRGPGAVLFSTTDPAPCRLETAATAAGAAALTVIPVAEGETIVEACDGPRVLDRMLVRTWRRLVVLVTPHLVTAGGARTCRTAAEVSGALERQLNAIYEPQCNIVFRLRTARELVGHGAAGSATITDSNVGDLVARSDWGADINLFFVRECENSAAPGSDVNGFSTHGFVAVIEDECPANDWPGVVAHEIGHLLSDRNHSAHQENLMCEYAPPGRRIGQRLAVNFRSKVALGALREEVTNFTAKLGT